jgi:hypothetical protein
MTTLGIHRKKAMPTSESLPATELAIPGLAQGPDAERSLLGVSTDLFSRLENSLVQDREEFIDDYFSTLAKRDELEMLWVDPPYYQHLKLVVRKEVLPLYDRYCSIRARILEKQERRQENRTWLRYCLITIAVCEFVELVASKGRSLRPQILIPSAVLEGFLGLGLYYLVTYRDRRALKSARESLLNSIREIDAKHEIARRYDTFRQYSGGELLNAELQELLSVYPSPAEFWRDYERVRKADPTTERELEELDAPRFGSFLQLHARGVYSPEARTQRFNDLFLLAHKAFVLADREGYVMRYLTTRKPENLEN